MKIIFNQDYYRTYGTCSNFTNQDKCSIFKSNPFIIIFIKLASRICKPWQKDIIVEIRTIDVNNEVVWINIRSKTHSNSLSLWLKHNGIRCLLEKFKADVSLIDNTKDVLIYYDDPNFIDIFSKQLQTVFNLVWREEMKIIYNYF